MVNQTDGMHWIAILLFKLQSPPLGFAINRDRTISSFLLLAVHQLQEHLAKSRFNLVCIHPPKQPLDRALMGRHPVCKP